MYFFLSELFLHLGSLRRKNNNISLLKIILISIQKVNWIIIVLVLKSMKT